jgi:CBS-domain-containing membrane protein
MYDLFLSWVRTAVPAAIGSFIAWLAVKGIVLDPAEATGLILAVGGACVTLYQVAVSTLQRKWPIVGVLLGSTKMPSYAEHAHPGVHSDRDLRGL